MNIRLLPQAKEDISYWNKRDKSKTRRIQSLLKSIMQTPFEGIGKPEALKYDLQNYWSRRIDKEHRLVYAIENDTIIVISCRFHYK